MTKTKINVQLLDGCDYKGKTYKPFCEEIDDRTCITFPVLFSLDEDVATLKDKDVPRFSGRVGYLSGGDDYVYVALSSSGKSVAYKEINPTFSSYLLSKSSDKLEFFSFRCKEAKRESEVDDVFEIVLSDDKRFAFSYNGESWSMIFGDCVE